MAAAVVGLRGRGLRVAFGADCLAAVLGGAVTVGVVDGACCCLEASCRGL